MMSNGRQPSRSPARTPPFILAGLLLLVCVLAYNYWTLTTTNSDLRSRKEQLEEDGNRLKDAHEKASKSFEETQLSLRTSEANLDQVRQTLKEREGELDSLQKELSNAHAETNKCKEDLAKCDQTLVGKSQDFESVLAERKNLEEQLEALRNQPPTCGLEQCLPPIKNVVAVFTKVVDQNVLRNALNGAQMDSNSIMGPAPEVPAQQPAEKPAEKPAEQPAAQQP